MWTATLKVLDLLQMMRSSLEKQNMRSLREITDKPTILTAEK